MSADAGAGIPCVAEPVPSIGTWAGLPLYGAGSAPEQLRTTAQLRRARLNVAEGQEPHAFLDLMPRHQRVPLYDPGEAASMAPLPLGTVERMRLRRTCVGCGLVAQAPLSNQREEGGECYPCWRKRRRAEAELRDRTCKGCGRVAQEPWPAWRCPPCAQAWEEELDKGRGGAATPRGGRRVGAGGARRPGRGGARHGDDGPGLGGDGAGRRGRP
jgi:hypothetical protein